MRTLSRRDFLFRAGEGISGVALAAMMAEQGLLANDTDSACANRPGIESPLSPQAPHFKPRAKNVISLFMSGGVSHLDSFDYKPDLIKHHGKPLTGFGRVQVRQGYPGPLMKSPFGWKQHGESGKWVSELFPHMGSIVDDVAFIHSAKGRSNDHVVAHYEWNTGSLLMGHPSVGCVGELWLGHGEPELAGVRGDL